MEDRGLYCLYMSQANHFCGAAQKLQMRWKLKRG